MRYFTGWLQHLDFKMTSAEAPNTPLKPGRLSRAQQQLESPARLADAEQTTKPQPADPETKEEIDGPDGLDPTRFGDWERNGRCIDF